MPSKPLSRNQFTFYASYFTAIEHLPKARRYEALRAVILYALEGAEPSELSASSSAVFDLIKPTLDSARIKAAARLREKGKEPAPDPFDFPTGRNKKENKKKNKSENKNERESKREDQCEGEKERKDETEGSCRPAGLSPRDDLDRIAGSDPALSREINEMIRFWQGRGVPLEKDERDINAWTLELIEPEDRPAAVRDSLSREERLIHRPEGSRFMGR